MGDPVTNFFPDNNIVKSEGQAFGTEPTSKTSPADFEFERIEDITDGDIAYDAYGPQYPPVALARVKRETLSQNESDVLCNQPAYDDSTALKEGQGSESENSMKEVARMNETTNQEFMRLFENDQHSHGAPITDWSHPKTVSQDYGIGTVKVEPCVELDVADDVSYQILDEVKCHTTLENEKDIISQLIDGTAACHDSSPDKDESSFNARQQHTSATADEKPFKCSMCEKTFPSIAHLKRHTRIIHTGEKRFKCATCGKGFYRRSDFTTHLISHSGEKPFECSTCGRAFAYQSILKKHIRVHTGEPGVRKEEKERTLKCPTCDKAFHFHSALQRHIRTHTGTRPFQCTTCRKSFSERAYLQIHMRTHTGTKPYECDLCGKAFCDRSNLRRHAKTHTGQKPYECGCCGMAFYERSKLHKHLETHEGSNPLECPKCGKLFSQISEVETHVLTHSGDKPYECGTCGKTFPERYRLRRHMDTHEIRNLFKSSTSPDLPGQQSNENNNNNNSHNHNQNVGENSSSESVPRDLEALLLPTKAVLRKSKLSVKTGELDNPLECPMCGKVFTQRSSLYVHFRIHTGEKPYECETCGKLFTQRTHLQSHERSHSGVKPFQCTTCGKAFCDNSNLQRHVKAHTGIKSFECGSCGKAFSRLSNLQVHLRTHLENDRILDSRDADSV